MTTGAQSVNLAMKRIVSAEDFRDRFLNYLLAKMQDCTKRFWSGDGVFDSPLTLSGDSANTFLIEQDVPGSFSATDGAGKILALGTSGEEVLGHGQIKSVVFENALATVYHVSLQATLIPSGIVINPRTGLPVYEMNVDAIGVRAEPDSVTDLGSSIRFVIDSVCEAAHSHAGRSAIVFRKSPARGALSSALAIEECTVSWNGVNNSITTAALLGQGAASTDPSAYEVVLLGPTVRKVDTSGTLGHAYVGNVTGAGAGNTPATTSTSGQQLIDKTLSDIISYLGGPDWADGTTNPVATIETQLDKIISDLTSTTAGRGAAKLTAPAAAGTPSSLSADTVAQQLADLLLYVNARAVLAGGNIFAGPQVVGGAVSISDTLYVGDDVTLDGALVDIALGDLQLGAGDIQLVAGGVTMAGSAAVGGDATVGGEVYAIGGNEKLSITQLAVSNSVSRAPDSSYTGDWSGAAFGRLGPAAPDVYVLVGTAGEIQSSPDGVTWTTRATGGAFAGALYDVAFGNGAFIAVGEDGEIQRSTDGETWSHIGNDGSVLHDFFAVHYDSAIGTWVVAGSSGAVQTSPDGSTWTARSNDGAFGGTFNSCASNGSVFVLVGTSSEIQHSADGITWTHVNADDYPSANAFLDVTHGNGRFVATGGPGSGKVQWSALGTAGWATADLEAFLVALDTAQFAGFWRGRFFVATQQGDLQASAAGVVWESLGRSPDLSDDIRCFAAGADMLLMGLEGGKIRTSMLMRA